MKISALVPAVAILVCSCSGQAVDYGKYYGQNSDRLGVLVAKIRSCGEVSYDDNVDRRVPRKCLNGDVHLYQQISSDLKSAGIRDAAYYPQLPKGSEQGNARSPQNDKFMFVLHSGGLMLGGGSTVTLWHDPAKDYVESGDVPQSEDGLWYLRKEDDLN